MRRAALIGVLLAACTVPAGSEVDECDGSWREVESRIVSPGGSDPEPVPIDCMRRVDDNRIRIGFRMPAGPSCFEISAIDVVEGGASVSVTLMVSRDNDPTTGACPASATRTATEVDLQGPVAERVLLDGSEAEERP